MQVFAQSPWLLWQIVPISVVLSVTNRFVSHLKEMTSVEISESTDKHWAASSSLCLGMILIPSLNSKYFFGLWLIFKQILPQYCLLSALFAGINLQQHLQVEVLSLLKQTDAIRRRDKTVYMWERFRVSVLHKQFYSHFFLHFCLRVQIISCVHSTLTGHQFCFIQHLFSAWW